MPKSLAGAFACVVLLPACGLAEMRPPLPPPEQRSVPGIQTVTGTYVGPGAPCPQFRLDSGETISLSGLYDRDLTRGVQMTLEGTWQNFSTCMQGRDFRVEHVVTPSDQATPDPTLPNQVLPDRN